MRVQPVTLGEIIDRKGSYFLNRKQGEQRIVSFEDHILSLTRGHILGEKPPSSGYQPHPFDVSSLEDAQELHLADFAKITTRHQNRDIVMGASGDRARCEKLLRAVLSPVSPER